MSVARGTLFCRRSILINGFWVLNMNGYDVNEAVGFAMQLILFTTICNDWVSNETE